MEPYKLFQSLCDGYRAVPSESDQQSFRQDYRDEREPAVGAVLVAMGFLRTANLGPGGREPPGFFCQIVWSLRLGEKNRVCESLKCKLLQ